MKIRRFVGKDMRSALAQIKEELGVDAVIMSNKKIPEGVELMAAVDYSQAPPVSVTSSHDNPSLSDQRGREIQNDTVNIQNTSAAALNREVPEPQIGGNQANSTTEPVDSLSALLSRQVQHHSSAQQSEKIDVQQGYTQQSNQVSSEDDNIEDQLRNFTQRLRHSKPDGTIPVPEASYTNEDAQFEGHTSLEAEQMAEKLQSKPTAEQGADLNNHVNQQDFDKMQQEMASIRKLLEHQVSGLMWQDMAQKEPQRAVLVNRLLGLGLNEQIADQIAGYVPSEYHDEQAWQQATKLIGEQLNTTQNDIIHRGGVVALVGPTGVGKTTTIAKLAARFSQVHGHEQVALISTDTFRIAGFEQLATYGKIIGCQVKLAKDSQALDLLLEQFSQKKLILIDTAGMGQRDIRLAENLANLVSNARVRIRNYLVLAANSQQQVMQENVDRFKKVPLSGCIYTKLDESVSVGEIITTSIQNGLPIGYLTDGQRVPEDIKVANAEKLVTLADKMAINSAKKNVAHVQRTARPMPIAPVVAI
ncbi:flagellar biosynthesis protein FlhF [Colwellia sp. 20A7]|uniref:flagellar biosynthesis protein FlhF n=1 Tax=Colwellia sp. 20A7 TaxID=2689569 RepID=UPI0013586C84|nr:flagellar biosynthesis protein FlhF [Colwellia sp. 20A7]